MVIGYNLFKAKDIYILEVLAACTVKFYFEDKLIVSEDLLEEETIDLTTSKDGAYKIILIDPNTNEETLVEFRVTYHLEKSIASDAYYILVGHDYDFGCKIYTETCKNKDDRKILRTREVFVKLLTYQLKYLPSISFNANLAFNNYMTKAMEEYKCNVQAKINKVLTDECNGNNTSSCGLFELYLAIYWAGMYFMAIDGVVDEDEKEYINSKYYYEYISIKLCGLAITMTELEDIYNNN